MTTDAQDAARAVPARPQRSTGVLVRRLEPPAWHSTALLVLAAAQFVAVVVLGLVAVARLDVLASILAGR